MGRGRGRIETCITKSLTERGHAMTSCQFRRLAFLRPPSWRLPRRPSHRPLQSTPRYPLPPRQPRQRLISRHPPFSSVLGMASEALDIALLTSSGSPCQSLHLGPFKAHRPYSSTANFVTMAVVTVLPFISAAAVTTPSRSTRPQHCARSCPSLRS